MDNSIIIKDNVITKIYNDGINDICNSCERHNEEFKGEWVCNLCTFEMDDNGNVYATHFGDGEVM